MTCVDSLFLNEHSQLKKWIKLKNTSVKTLLNDDCPEHSYEISKMLNFRKCLNLPRNTFDFLF